MVSIQAGKILAEEGLKYKSYNFLEAGSELWSLSLLIPLLPYIAAFIILYLGAKKQNENLNHNISIIANAGSLLFALVIFADKF